MLESFLSTFSAHLSKIECLHVASLFSLSFCWTCLFADAQDKVLVLSISNGEGKKFYKIENPVSMF
jgi:hypothetical protein